MEVCLFFLFLQARKQARGSYDEKWTTHNFYPTSIRSRINKNNKNYYLFLQQLRMGRKVIYMYTKIQNYLFSLYNPYGGGRGQKQQLRNKKFLSSCRKLVHEKKKRIYCLCLFIVCATKQILKMH